ncbi:5'-nucleotidase C-terminal domain-containing protein [Metabacillus sp. GX 13764]|uniref:5'-nucleotidase C-terminal domain-containing protein n=1 Tax=Metabacillus kandeliae TaxID=2900151 RepID=UPI001E2D4BA9|nr:5'-nucleotidase C-terminal domain-containing protein [Metabacillus kandeliae]MCD7034782.1 5'-nucleotidase C-terminal domain-containing protein [Metabacillus kandeliae]
MNNKIKTVLSLTLAASVIPAAAPAHAAEKNTPEELVHIAEAQVRSLAPYNNSMTLSKNFLQEYHLTQSAIANAKKALPNVKNARQKRLLGDRIEKAEMAVLRTARVIDALKYGEALLKDTSSFIALISKKEKADEELHNWYDKIRTERRAYEKIVGKVSGSDSRKAFGLKYIVPAKLAEEMMAYPLTRYDLNVKALAAIAADKPEVARKLVDTITKMEEKGDIVKAALLKLYPNNKAVQQQISIIEGKIEAELALVKQSIMEALKPKSNFNLEVLHTNDTHAHIDNIARRITAIKEMRAKAENSLLLDAGDVFSGTLYFNEFKGQADLEFMNMIGYDAMTFGNHEFDLGTAPLSSFVKNAKFPFVSANVDFTKDANMKGLVGGTAATAAPKDGNVYPSIIKEMNGEKVGIFGLTTAETETISSPGKDVAFNDYIERAKKSVEQLKAQGVNKIIALTHIGYQDGGGDNDVTLAKEVDGIDIIVGGHSHTVLSTPTVDTTGAEPTVIVQTGQYSDNLGTLNVEFDPSGKVIKNEGKLINLNEKSGDSYAIKADDEAQKILDTKYKPVIDAKQKEVVASTDVALNGARADVRTKETNLGNLITDGMLSKAKTINPNTVIALQNGGGIRESINSGDVTMGEILTVMPFGNALAIMKLSGEEIKAALEHSVEAVPTEAGAFLQVSGMRFSYDSTKPAGQRVVKVEVKEDGKTFTTLDPAKQYFVATNTFTAAGGDNYPMFKKAYDEGRVSEPGFVDWENFRDYLKANPGLKPEVEGRITDVSK